MNKLDKKKKLILIISIAVLIALAIASSTFAYFGWIAEEESTIDVTVIGGTGSCLFKSDNNIELEPVSTRDSGRIVKFTAKQELAGEAPIAWNMVINEIGGLQDPTFRYELINTTTGASYGSGNFANITNEEGSNTITFSNNTEKLTYNTEYEFTLYLWIDGTIGNNPLTMANQTLDFDMNCIIDGTSGSGSSGSGNTLIDHITNLYTSGNPTLITQSTSNDTYYYSYQDDTSTWGLMNDGLTIDTTQDATTTGLAKVVTDTTKLTSGTQGNIRYFGPSDSVNNYIYFNCDTYPDTNCELWRIIGIVDGKVKIIRNDSLGDMQWDDDSNDWSTSTLNTYLNNDYYNSLNTKNNKTISLISEETWYLGGKSSPSGLYPNDIYNHERQNITGTTIYGSNPFTINTSIGIMYASDYGYGTDLTKCSKDIYSYENSANSYACRANNWLFNSANQWLITPGSSDSDDAWAVSSSGYVNRWSYVDRAGGVRPVLYLNSELAIESGHAGTSTDPYRISVS